MSKTLVRTAVAVCVAVVALTASQAVRAADEKAAAPVAPVAPKSEAYSGKIQAVDVAASTITVQHKKETKTFSVAPDCKFSGAGKKVAALADLKVGDHVKVTYTQDGDKMVAHHIGHIEIKKKTEEVPAAKP